MNKRALIKFLLVLITLLVSLFIMGLSNDMFSPGILVYLLVPVTIVMFYYRKAFVKHKKTQFVYDIILIILMLLSFLGAGYFIISVLMSLSNYDISSDFIPYFSYLYIMSLITLLLFSIFDILKKTDKKNDILVISICLVTILMMFRVYIIPGFNQDIYVYYEVSHNIYNYVSEFYVYFLILNVSAVTHYLINRVK